MWNYTTGLAAVEKDEQFRPYWSSKYEFNFFTILFVKKREIPMSAELS